MKKITDLKEYFSKIKDGDKVYEFLCNINEETQKGRHDFNENLYVNVVSYETKESFEGVFESHKDYIDLHVLVSGEEKIYYGDREKMIITKDYDKDGDYELLKGQDYSSVAYSKMQGVECAVNEPHMAAGSVSTPSKVLKAIVKIKN